MTGPQEGVFDGDPADRGDDLHPKVEKPSKTAQAAKASAAAIKQRPTGLSKKDFTSDQEVRWCPGCGDYAILATVQSFLPELGVLPDDIVFVSGIGCSGRFSYYTDTYGLHGIHGRAPALATGIALADPDLSVWVVTGDGDALSIGGNHLIHTLRRNVNIKILLFNNQIYGLTKGQYSPTSAEGKVTKSTPFGSLDHPFDPVALALGAEASFVARSLDNDRQHLTEVLRQAVAHRGSAFVEIYQNCNVFNDGAFDALREKSEGMHNQIRLEHGKPIIFDDGARCVSVGDNGRFVITAVVETDPDRIVVHDVHGRPSLAFALAHISRGPTEPTCIGVFREEERPVYGELMEAQVAAATERLGVGDLKSLLHAGDTWEVT
ncbi:MAG: 2-oxoacid:ferredoxin oxidoreductase subunit beta [Actinomycetota bacterium]